MKYEIIEKSWSKRRTPTPAETVRHIEILNFEKVHNHFCQLAVSYADGRKALLHGRVIYNEIKNHWTIDAMHIAIRLIN